MTDATDELNRVYSRILAIRQNLPKEIVAKETCQIYDDLVDRAQQASGRNLEEFNVGNKFLTPNSLYYHSDGVRSQIDGLTNYLRSMIAPETVQRIGFPAT